MSGYSIDYEELETALAGAALACGAAEAHGLLCGLLSGGSGTEEAQWRQELAARGSAERAEPLQEEPLVSLLGTLSAESRATLHDQAALFVPLLPEEGAALAVRAAGVRDWALGFLYGLGLNQRAAEANLSEPAREGLRDLVEITRLAAEEVEESEEEEAHLMELVEYLRVVVTLLVDELLLAQAEEKRGVKS